MAATRSRPWDGYPTAYSIFNPHLIPGFQSTYMARYLIGVHFRALSDPYLDWIEQFLPDASFNLVLDILDVTQSRSYSRRTRDGFTIGVKQPVAEYLADSSEEAMARLADRDAAAFEKVLAKRWHTPPPPAIDYPAVGDVPSWRRLGRLLSAGETPEPLIELWRRGELDTD